jgi:hypothetical protein
MARKVINRGSVANDGKGDTLRVAFGKVNDNFLEVYTSLSALEETIEEGGGSVGGSGFDGVFSSLTDIPTTLSGYGITDAQPLDPDLTAIAALATTSFGRSLLTQASAAAARSTLGAGTSSFDGVFASLTSKPTTLSGYGITDAEAALGNPASNGYVLSSTTGGVRSWISAGGTGTVTSFSLTTANGVSGSVANASTTPALTVTLGAITPSSVNSIVFSGSSTPTLAVTGTSTISGANTGDQTSVTGNAGTATALATARNINGVAFDGTANITVTAAAGTLTGTTLASNVVTSSLTTVGTIGTGVWQGTAVADSYVASASTWNAKEAALTFSTGLTRSTNTITVNTTQNIAKLSNLTSNGFVKTSGGDGTLSVDTASYLTTTGSAASLTSIPVVIQLACSDTTTDITSGTGKLTFRMPFAMTVTAVRASVSTAPTGSTILIDINEAGSTILGNKLMIDASEKTSQTAATAATITDSALADDAEITIDFDQVGSSTAGKGVVVSIIGTK